VNPANPRISEGDLSPLTIAEEKPPLVPLDVWLSYQQEQTRRSEEQSESGFSELTTQPVPVFHEPGPTPELVREALAQVGLAEGLTETALRLLARKVRQGAVPAGEYLFREGERATAFFIVLEGAVEILRTREAEREIVLRHMKRGEAIGLFGLFSGGRRRAACARAIGDVGVLEIPFQAVKELLTHVTDLQNRLLRFAQERLLESFLASSKLFSDVDSIARGRILSRFTTRRLTPSDVLVHPGEVANLFAIVLSGSLLLEHRSRPGTDAQLFQTYPGEFVAITSALSGAPCRMRVFAMDDADVAVLSHKNFAELLRDYPALRSLSGRLPSHARMLLRDVFCGHTGVTGL
jgi:CRP-like cAMP-binding protein